MKHPTGRQMAFSIIAAAALALWSPVSTSAHAVGEAKGTVSIAAGWDGFSWAVQGMASTYEALMSVSRDLRQRRGQ